VSGPADNDKRFEHVLTSILREDPGPSRQNCPHPGLLSAYFEGELTEPETRELEVHLSNCNGCQAELAALVRLQAEPASEETRPEPVAVGAPGEPSLEAATKAAPAEAKPFRPKRRRTFWNWGAPVALAASAVLAISVTYRFSPLIGQASRQARESGVGTREPQNASPAARRDEDASAMAPQMAPAAPTTAASPQPPLASDTTQGSGSKSALSEFALRQNAETTSPEPQEVEPQVGAAPTALAPAPSAAPEGAARTKQAAEDQLAPSPANQERGPALAKAAKLPTEPALVIVARTNLDVAWRLGDASIERSDDAGKTWRVQPSGDATGLLAGSAPSPNVCWLAGRSGLVLRTTDGEHWERLASPTTSDLTQVIASNDMDATVHTAGGERFDTSDGGRMWSKH
jgi:anti-sigma factor RsiW